MRTIQAAKAIEPEGNSERLRELARRLDRLCSTGKVAVPVVDGMRNWTPALALAASRFLDLDTPDVRNRLTHMENENMFSRLFGKDPTADKAASAMVADDVRARDLERERAKVREELIPRDLNGKRATIRARLQEIEADLADLCERRPLDLRGLHALASDQAAKDLETVRRDKAAADARRIAYAEKFGEAVAACFDQLDGAGIVVEDDKRRNAEAFVKANLPYDLHENARAAFERKFKALGVRRAPAVAQEREALRLREIALLERGPETIGDEALAKAGASAVLRAESAEHAKAVRAEIAGRPVPPKDVSKFFLLTTAREQINGYDAKRFYETEERHAGTDLAAALKMLGAERARYPRADLVAVVEVIFFSRGMRCSRTERRAVPEAANVQPAKIERELTLGERVAACNPMPDSVKAPVGEPTGDVKAE